MTLRRSAAAAALVAAVALLPASAAFAAPKSSSPTVGYDVSWPQCGGALPSKPAFGIVGVNDGRPYGDNPCLGTQYDWAAAAPKPPAFYMNTANPGAASTRTNWYSTAGPRQCDSDNEAGCAYNYGWHAARYAVDYASRTVGAEAAAAAVWWLDVETANSWSSDLNLNLADIQGSLDYLTGVVGPGRVGIYSTGYQWGQITGGAQLGPGVPNWVAGALNAKRAPSMCSSSFSGGKVHLVQYPSGGFDADYACP